MEINLSVLDILSNCNTPNKIVAGHQVQGRLSVHTGSESQKNQEGSTRPDEANVARAEVLERQVQKVPGVEAHL